MKILFFIESLHSGGKERRLVELIKGLSNNKSIKMDIVLTKENIHYDDIFSANINIHYIFRKSKKDVTVFFKFLKLAKSLKSDIIHVWGNMVAIYAIPAKILLRIPMINNQISDAPSKLPNSLLNHKLSFPFSNLIIANSYAGLNAYKAPVEKSKVIYNGFNFDRLLDLEDEKKIKERLNIKTEIIVAMVATFSEKKDYESYIKAANIILAKNRNVTFLCIGAGDDTVYKSMVNLTNRNHVLFLGKQQNVENIMNVCDIGVLSTYTEGISNALLEFCALGKPVVTNFGGGNVELVENDVTGYLVKQKSPIELAEKINILITNKKQRQLFGKNAKKKVTNQFSIDSMLKSFKNIYQTYSR